MTRAGALHLKLRTYFAALSNLHKGMVFGLIGTVIGGLYVVFSQQAAAMGLNALDLVALRYGVAGTVLFPVLLRYGPLKSFGGLGLPKALAITAFGGLGFALLFYLGFNYAPLAHGAVIPGAVTAVVGAFLGMLIFQERFARKTLLALALIIAGLTLVGGRGLVQQQSGLAIGDALFATAGVSWALFLALFRLWRITPMQGASVVAVLTAAGFLPLYVFVIGYENLTTVATQDLAIQLLVHGVLVGVGAIYFFGQSVVYLNTAVASALPSLIPAQAILLGALLFGVIPSTAALVGLAFVICGQLVGSGLISFGRKA